MISYANAVKKAEAELSPGSGSDYQIKVRIKAQGIWEKALREKFAELNDELYQLCYDQVVDTSFGIDHDDFGYNLSQLVIFVQKAVDAANKGE